MRHRFRWLAVPAVLVLSACGDSHPTTPSPQDIAGVWHLAALQRTGQPLAMAPAGVTLSADFGGDGRVSLVADCNRCNAGYEIDGGTLRVGRMACTLAACPSATLDTDFAGLVQAAGSWSVLDGRLELRSADGAVRLRR